MQHENIQSSDGLSANVSQAKLLVEMLTAHGKYKVECFDAEGNTKWEDEIKNLVTTVGKNDMLDKYLAGSGYTASVVMGLKGTGTAVIGDTQASHAPWLEVGLANAPTYTGPRKTPAFSSAAAGSKATSAAVSFAITGSGTVAGCFINVGGASTIDNTTGVLFSAGDFSGGARTVANGDTLAITYTATLT